MTRSHSTNLVEVTASSRVQTKFTKHVNELIAEDKGVDPSSVTLCASFQDWLPSRRHIFHLKCRSRIPGCQANLVIRLKDLESP